jgi:hypothetical protein
MLVIWMPRMREPLEMGELGPMKAGVLLAMAFDGVGV